MSVGEVRSRLRLLASLRRLGRRWWLSAAAVPAAVAFTSWYLTEPLTDRGAPGPVTSATAPPVAVPAEARSVARAEAVPLAWPEGRLEGRPAKILLLETLIAAADRLNRVNTYTASLYKQERIKGTLGPGQTLAMKVRHKPFALYLKFLAPQEGKEVVYAEGHHDNKLIAHAAGVARFLVPRLAVPPDHPLAMADARHPVTEAGLANLTSRLIEFRRMDLDDPEAGVVLDRTTDPKGRSRFRSVHTHLHYRPERPFMRTEVLYDPKTLLPVDIKNFDWPEKDGAEPLLAEHYSYDDINLGAHLTALDFDPKNPNYAFHRY
jgi:hypothetical protein